MVAGNGREFFRKTLKRDSMRKHMTILLTVAIGTVAVATAGHWLLKKPDTRTPAFKPASFTRTHLEQTIESTAVVQPRNRIEIRPPISGRIDEVLVEEGHTVRKGEVIARMSSTERATLLDAARAKGDAAYSKWENAYKPTPLVAPLDGRIIARGTEPGQTVTAADTVLVLSDRLIVSAQVDETDIGAIHVGQRAVIVLDAYRNIHICGTVTRIAYEAVTHNNVTIYAVEVEPETVPDCMKSGMTASATFTVREVQGALTLPSDAIIMQDGHRYVLIDAGVGRQAERRMVKTGLTGNGRIEVIGGLDGSETVLRKSFSMVTNKEAGTSPFVPSPPRRKP